MRVGLIAEGRGDLAVLVNILKGKLGLDFEDIQFLRPEYDQDETDVHDQDEAQRGGWGRVKRECVERRRIREFVGNAIDEEILVVVQIDTAEAHDKGYDVEKPRRDDPGYAEILRQRVVDKIDGWLEGESDLVRHAVAVEETEAWVLTIFSPKDSTTHGNPKAQLQKLLNKTMSDKDRRRHFQLKEYDQAYALTKPFRKLRDLEKFVERNRSLRLFVDSLGAGRSRPGPTENGG
ncbi:hypothetical protein WME75_11600 [Sorangium sp. So ce1014]|uniref:hypothetical protein n=1 Tax=Sorangium sp. So ce1014 TaxID=3133326 RepID=UPI003F61AFC3